ncbi:hypothetical protein [Halobacillus dabanensis]|uniref:hypothetical protein n=1 Tax=Halobacillus dabanensis TaxID=240302 RepID=UPI0009433775|nr:hypothetical protein [Halobacillus dabanensis]
MPHLTKLLLEQNEWSLPGRYSVRIDRTIVIEPLRQLTEDTFKQMLNVHATIHSIGIKNSEVPSIEKYDGPFSFQRVNGILIFKPVS